MKGMTAHVLPVDAILCIDFNAVVVAASAGLMF